MTDRYDAILTHPTLIAALGLLPDQRSRDMVVDMLKIAFDAGEMRGIENTSAIALRTVARVVAEVNGRPLS